MDVSKNSGTPKSSILYDRVFHYKPSILGYPYFWKHPDVSNVVKRTPRHGMPKKALVLRTCPGAKNTAALILKICPVVDSRTWNFAGPQNREMIPCFFSRCSWMSRSSRGFLHFLVRVFYHLDLFSISYRRFFRSVVGISQNCSAIFRARRQRGYTQWQSDSLGSWCILALYAFIKIFGYSRNL